MLLSEDTISRKNFRNVANNFIHVWKIEEKKPRLKKWFLTKKQLYFSFFVM